jgi:hypothetical protein
MLVGNGYMTVIRDPKNAPNSAIERYVVQGYYQVFGKRRLIPGGVREWLRCELNYRNRAGIYIAGSYKERCRMRRRETTIC